jgi:hypothetical protein
MGRGVFPLVTQASPMIRNDAIDQAASHKTATWEDLRVHEVEHMAEHG